MIRYPLTSLFAASINATANVQHTFTLPANDIDGLVVKLVAQTMTNNNNLDVFVQTSDDGGTTFYDCVHFQTLNNTVTNANAMFATIPVNIGDGVLVSSPGNGSIAASTRSGLPLLGLVGRVRWIFTGASGTSLCSATVSLLGNNQSHGR